MLPYFRILYLSVSIVWNFPVSLFSLGQAGQVAQVAVGDDDDEW